MRRMFCLALLGMVFATGVAQAAGPKDYAKGSGTAAQLFMSQLFEFSFSFNAWSDPANNDPQGTMKLEFRGATYYATVTCLSVLGQHATIWGDIQKISGDDFFQGAADGIRFSVTDSRLPAVADSIDFTLTTDSVGAGQCLAFPGENPTTGNITVIDE